MHNTKSNCHFSCSTKLPPAIIEPLRKIIPRNKQSLILGSMGEEREKKKTEAGSRPNRKKEKWREQTRALPRPRPYKSSRRECSRLSNRPSPVIIDQRNCGSRLSADRWRIYTGPNPLFPSASPCTSPRFGPKHFRGRSRARCSLSLQQLTDDHHATESLLSFPLVYPTCTRRDTLFPSLPLSPYFSIRLPTSRHGDQLRRLLVTYVFKERTNAIVLYDGISDE